jgi:hypothetical protein
MVARDEDRSEGEKKKSWEKKGERKKEREKEGRKARRKGGRVRTDERSVVSHAQRVKFLIDTSANGAEEGVVA